jgi:spore coat polysaccharide biosynthesis protein SpsF
MKNKNIAIFITARMGSTRLPGKHMLPIEGKPIIEHLVDRVKFAKLKTPIILCTTIRDEDDILEKEANRLGILCFRGHSTDILKRWSDAAEKYEIDFIISAEGDDIFCDPDCMDKVVDCYLKTDADYIVCDDLPVGVTPTGIKVEALQKACRLKKDDHTEGQYRYFIQTGLFRVERIKGNDPELAHPEIRMTLDYKEDYTFFKRIFHDLYMDDEIFGMRKILRHLKGYPDIILINANMQKEYEKRSAELYPPLGAWDENNCCG